MRSGCFFSLVSGFWQCSSSRCKDGVGVVRQLRWRHRELMGSELGAGAIGGWAWFWVSKIDGGAGFCACNDVDWKRERTGFGLQGRASTAVARYKDDGRGNELGDDDWCGTGCR